MLIKSKFADDVLILGNNTNCIDRLKPAEKSNKKSTSILDKRSQTNLSVVVVGSIVQRTLSEGVEHESAAMLEQPFDYVDVPSAGSEVQRRSSVAVPEVWVHLLFGNL